MLKFEGIKEFDIEKLDNPILSRNFQIIFSDDMLDENDCEVIEKKLNEHNFNIKDEIVKIEVIYNIDLDTATISMVIHCPLMDLNQFPEKGINELLNKHKTNFENFYSNI